MSADTKSTQVAVPAIARKDLQALLEKHGLLRPFLNGELHCKSCEKIVNSENIGALLVRGGLLLPFCNSPECIDEAVQGSAK